MARPDLLALLRNPKSLSASAATTPQVVKITEWTVAYDDQGNLTSSATVTPDSGISISGVATAIYAHDAAMTIIAAGSGTINNESDPGVEDVWGASAITGQYQQGHGTTVTAVVFGFVNTDFGFFYFSQDFQI